MSEVLDDTGRPLKASLQDSPTKLFDILDRARRSLKASLQDLTVLSPRTDPYRINDGIAGLWFKDRLRQLGRRLHLRGHHYRTVGPGNIRRPDGTIYENTEEHWRWLQETAAKCARWLSLIAFSAITDERNAAADVPDLPEPTKVKWEVCAGGIFYEPPTINEAPSLEDALPRFNHSVTVRQPYRLVLIGEKSSLAEELKPVAEKYGAELVLPNGEISDTLIAEMVARAAEDGRPTRIFYFSDFDPSGWQMPISVSRKIQALSDLYDLDLDIEVHRAALTKEQAEEYGLPSTPLKSTELRGNKWKQATGREQTEIDALLSLKPGALREIAAAVIAPFYDPSLQSRAQKLAKQRARLERRRLEHRPGYRDALKEVKKKTRMLKREIGVLEQKIKTVFEPVEAARKELEAAQHGVTTLIARHSGTVDPPAPKFAAEPPEPLFTSADDYITATRKLIASKALDGEGGE